MRLRALREWAINRSQEIDGENGDVIDPNEFDDDTCK
jgi:hypothetical protein